MKPSTKAALAVNGLIELAKLQPAKPLALSTLAEKQSISLSYLEQVFAALRRAGLVLSVRGPGGGYLLAKPADAITTGEIIAAVDSEAISRASNEDHTDKDAPTAAANAFWDYIGKRVSEVYHDVSLQDVLDGGLVPQEAQENYETQAAE